MLHRLLLGQWKTVNSFELILAEYIINQIQVSHLMSLTT